MCIRDRYDDGQNSQNGQQDYEVPDLFLKDKTRSDQKNKQQKNQLIRKAERSVFLSTKKEKLGHDQKLLRKYLFTAKFSGTKSVGIDNNSSGQDQADLKILLINILLFLALGAGIWLGIKFPSFFRKLKVRRDEGVNDRQ